MRSLVLTLLAIDLLLLGWGLTRPPGAPSSAGVVIEPLPATVDRLVLLSETTAAAPRVNAPVLAAGAVQVCVRAGPLPDAQAAAAVVTRAGSLGMAARSEPVDLVVGPPDLLVHLPPLPSPEQASRAVRELAAIDVDAAVVPSGPHAGAVSVGVYAEAANAQQRVAELAGLGYEVRIAELPRARRVWDVHLRATDLEAVDAFLVGLRLDWPELGGDREPCDLPPAAG